MRDQKLPQEAMVKKINTPTVTVMEQAPNKEDIGRQAQDIEQ